MPAQLLDGKAIADQIRAEVAADVAKLHKATGRTPGLSVLLVGDDPASETYVRNKSRAAEGAGIRSETLRLPAQVSTNEVAGLVDTLNRRDDVDGILIQLPLPRHIESECILGAVDAVKDVDGFHALNVGSLVANRPCHIPCTPAGIMQLLQRSSIELDGCEAVVLGRSNIVGKPMALLLLHANATVTICHSRSRNLAEITRRADLLIAAIGKPGFVTEEHVRPGAIVIDVGINRVDDPALARDLLQDDPRRLDAFTRNGSILVGDCHPGRVARVAGKLTPVPGGVGPLTIAMLLMNTVRAFRQLRGL